MAETMKNRERFAIGTRVRPSAKAATRTGTVVDHDTDAFGVAHDTVAVLWDGDETPCSGYMPFELKKEQ